jgi:hypothetical protein
VSSPSFAACDKAGAVNLQANIAQFATWKERGGAVEVTWDDFFAGQPIDNKRKMIEAFANIDACITGTARDIRFYEKGRLMAVASPTSGISLIPTAGKAGKSASQAQTLVVRGHAIQPGMEADKVFAILKSTEMLEQEVGKDPALAGSLRLTKRYKADGKAFTLVFARKSQSGPYVITTVTRN